MLTRLAYYHRQTHEFIGPHFVIVCLQGSIILILLAFALRRDWQIDILLKEKDVLTRAVLDFVDIFNLVEVLSANECVGVGSFLPEESSIEKAIQAFCTMSFLIVYGALTLFENSEQVEVAEFHFYYVSMLVQNFPFLIIRIVIWARYKLYSLGFLVKNVIAIAFCLAKVYKLISAV